MNNEAFLAADLHSLSTGTCEDPLDPVTLAEYIDRVLNTEDTQRVEEHLATCRTCRELATEAGLAIAEGDPTEKSKVAQLKNFPQLKRQRFGRSFLALAATLLILLGTGFLLKSWQVSGFDERFLDVGVEESDFGQATPELQNRARQALQGQLEELDLFSDFFTPQDGLEVRVAGMHENPEPLQPRWSLVREKQPTFRWYLPTSSSEDTNPVQGEIILVDHREQLVAALPFEFVVQTPGNLAALPWPAEQAPLEFGGAYAWKVNLEVGGTWLSSEFVPFQVSENEIHLPSNDFLASVELASFGFYEEALERLVQAEIPQPGENIRRHLLRTILSHKRFSADLTERESQRWLLTEHDLLP